MIVSAFFLIMAVVILPQFYSPARTMGNEIGDLADARYSAEMISGAVNTISHDTTAKVSASVPGIPLKSGWRLKIETDVQPPKLLIQVPTSKGLENVGVELNQSFDNLGEGDMESEISIERTGPVAVIVKQNFEDKEGFDNNYLESDKLYIHVNRGG